MSDGEATAHLVQAALWATGGESIEGAFVDRYESHSDQAIDELLGLGFGKQMDRPVLEALDDPKIDLEKAARFVYRVARDHPGFLTPLPTAPSPQLREIYYRAVGQFNVEVDWSQGLADPDERVRSAALAAMRSRVPSIPGSEEAARQALRDPSPLVRRTAAARVDFFRKPEGADALADLIQTESDPAIVGAALIAIAESVNRAGISLATPGVEKGLGPRLKRSLIEALRHPSGKVREQVARALHRLVEPETARAILDRILVEEDHAVRGTLLLYPGLATVPDESLPVLARLATEGDDLARVRCSFLLENFGHRAIKPLRQALGYAHSRRAAAMSLGKVGDLPCLPSLMRALWEAEDAWEQRDIETAITDVAINAAHREESVERPESAPILQPLIDAGPERNLQNYPEGAVRETFNALPVLGDQFETWAIRSDGAILCVDHESIRMEEEVVEDGLKVFSVYLHAAIQYPDIEPLLPQPPKSARLCRRCMGRGIVQEDRICGHCARFGWVHKDY